jgi:FkbH-like protein
MLNDVKKYSEIIDFNYNKKRLLKKNNQEILKAKIYGNISCFQLKEYIAYFMLQKNVNIEIELSDYDNLLSDHSISKDCKFSIVFWELSNLFNGAQYKIEMLNGNQINNLIDETIKKINLFINNITKNSLLIFNKFSTMHFNINYFEKTKYQLINDKLNSFLETKKNNNFILMDINQIISEIGTDNAVSYRDFYLSKSIYNLQFYKRYSYIIANLILSKTGRYKKVLVLDCDNTLWKGIAVEDGIDKLEMDEITYPGCIFFEVQHLINKLYKKGILICLCSKNNLEDIKKIFKLKTYLKLNQFADIRINWDDKPKNLKKISEKLNLGLDSFVFIDDSDFEINYIKKTFPEVTTFKVPIDNLYDYPKMIREISNLFYTNLLTEEDKKKNLYYFQEEKREKTKSKFISLEDYINTLKLSLIVEKNNIKHLARVTQLTQKTNQFNSSLKRFSENEIEKFIMDDKFDVYTLRVSDKFGESGLTAICILKKDIKKKICVLNTFLMSCRIFGRKIEFIFLNYIENKLRKLKIKKILINFKIGPRNSNVESFLIEYGFIKKKNNNTIASFEKNIGKLKSNKIENLDIKIKKSD